MRFPHPDSGKLLDWPMLQSEADAGIRLRTVLACNNMEAVLGATVRGLGIACMPDFLVRDTSAAGRLVSVLDGHPGAGGRFSAVWPSSRHLSPKVRAFVDHLARRLADPAGARA